MNKLFFKRSTAFMSIVITCLMTLTISCTKDKVYEPSDQLTLPSIKILNIGGIPVPIFKDLKAVIDAHHYFSSKEGNDSYSGFVSMDDAFHEIEDQDYSNQKELEKKIKNNPYTVWVNEDDSSLESQVGAPYLAKLVNEIGDIIINNTLYNFQHDCVRSISLEKLNENDNFKKFRRYVISKGDIKVFSIEKEITTIYKCNDKCLNNYANKRRLKGKLWYFNFGIFKLAGATTTSQKKSFLVWTGSKSEWISVSITGPEWFSPLSLQKNNKKKVTINLGIAAGNTIPIRPDIYQPGVILNASHAITQFSCGTCRVF